MKATTTKEQLANAKKTKQAIGIVGIDGRHLSKADGGFGSFVFSGPIPTEFKDRIYDLIRDIAKSPNKSKLKQGASA
jgi:hypothetical protein